MIVVDASVLAPALGDDSNDGSLARLRLGHETLAAPDLIDLETASVLRRLVRVGSITVDRATDAIRDLTDLPLRRVQHRALLTRCWELREDLTAYDAGYVAVAELPEITLITADARLARSPGSGAPWRCCTVDRTRRPVPAVAFLIDDSCRTGPKPRQRLYDLLDHRG